MILKLLFTLHHSHISGFFPVLFDLFSQVGCVVAWEVHIKLKDVDQGHPSA